MSPPQTTSANIYEMNLHLDREGNAQSPSEIPPPRLLASLSPLCALKSSSMTCNPKAPGRPRQLVERKIQCKYISILSPLGGHLSSSPPRSPVPWSPRRSRVQSKGSHSAPAQPAPLAGNPFEGVLMLQAATCQSYEVPAEPGSALLPPLLLILPFGGPKAHGQGSLRANALFLGGSVHPQSSNINTKPSLPIEKHSILLHSDVC